MVGLFVAQVHAIAVGCVHEVPKKRVGGEGLRSTGLFKGYN